MKLYHSRTTIWAVALLYIATLQGNCIIFDLGGVLLKTNYIRCIQKLGVFNCIQYWWNGGSVSNLSTSLFRFLDTIPCNTTGTYTVYGPNGKQLPGIVQDWLRGTDSGLIQDQIAYALAELLERVYEHKSPYVHSLLEYRLVCTMCDMIFNPRHVADTQQLVRAGVSFVQSCKRAGHSVYILSNWSSESFDVLEQTSPFKEFFQLFDGIIISGDVQCAKPDPAIYQYIFHLICHDHPGTVPEECVFIDDQIENIMAAQQFGFQAIWCTPKNIYCSQTPDFLRIRKKMKQLSLL